ncbi:hypothetical protein JCM30237_27110 [Halolamina litorea]|uniref:Uncharacterized protein n=1 Tax=Halolamina litorea TaxID=1515593 RepID=A0ABD6BN24_9EURY|nr:hypothetical protein [Halolamina litorea]
MSQISTWVDPSTFDGLVEFLPTLLGAVAILVVGLVVGRIVGGIVTRLARRVGLGHYAGGTAVEGVERNDGIARGLGRVVAYYVYLVALLAAADVLGINELTSLLSDLGSYTPVVLGALAVLIVGFVAGRIVGDMVAGVVSDFGVGRYLRETPFAAVGDEYPFSYLVGTLVTYYVYLLTLLAAADILDIGALSTLLNEFASYLPALTAGLLVLLVGVWLAERAAEVTENTGDGQATHVAGLAVKLLVYYLTITVTLATVGVDVSVLTNLLSTVVVVFSGALGLSLAIAFGLAFGLGGRDFVAENIDDWAASIGDVVADGDGNDEDGFQFD